MIYNSKLQKVSSVKNGGEIVGVITDNIQDFKMCIQEDAKEHHGYYYKMVSNWKSCNGITFSRIIYGDSYKSVGTDVVRKVQVRLRSNIPKYSTNPLNDYNEDYTDNVAGWHMLGCKVCKYIFYGHEHRKVCKTCVKKWWFQRLYIMLFK